MERMLDGLVTTLQAAKVAGVSRRAIQRLVSQGKVKAHKFGGVYLVEVKSVKEYFMRAPSAHIRGRKPKNIRIE